MKKLLVMVMAGIALASFSAMAQDGDNIARTFFVQTKMGHGDAFTEGVKKYWECYEANGGDWTWTAWSRTSGRLGLYVFRSDGHNWADFDADNTAGQACGDTFDANVTPHVETFEGGWSRDMPDVSRHEEGDMTVAYVGVFWVNDSRKFEQWIDDTHKATTEKEWGHYHWGAITTSDDGADYYVAIMNADFADMAPPETSFWEIQEQVHGSRKVEQMRQTLSDIIDKSAWHIWSRVDDISYSPGN